MSALELAVSSAIIRLRALERGLHDIGPWSIEFDGVRYPARRAVLADGVRFTIAIDGPRSGTALLMCRDAFVLAHEVDVERGPCEIDVDLVLDTAVAA